MNQLSVYLSAAILATTVVFSATLLKSWHDSDKFDHSQYGYHYEHNHPGPPGHSHSNVLK